MIEWKLFWIGTATVVSLALAAITVTGVLWVPLTVGAASLLAAVAAVLSHVIVEACEMWRGAARWQRRRVWLGSTGAAAAYAAWTITAVLLPLAWLNIVVMIAALGLLSVLAYWIARGVEWRLTTAPPPPVRTAADPDALLGEREKIFKAAVIAAGLKGVRVMPGAEPLRADAGWQFRVQLVSRSTLAARERAGSQTELTQKAMEPLAIALAEITGKTVNSDWVRLRKESGAGVYSITVTSRDVMAEVIEYKDDPTPTSITEPALVGVELDGREHRERLDQHTRGVGGSTGGKSSLIQCEFAHITRCTDAVLWVAGVQKLYDLVGSWVEPYEDTGLRPPIDWIAHGQTDTLRMMAAAMAVARWRQRQPMSKRSWRKIIVELDEFSFVAQSPERIWFDGQSCTASDLVSMLLRGAASGNVYIHVASQRSTVDHYGDKGGDVIANIGVNNAFRSKDFAEIGRLTNDYQLPVPTHRGEFYRFAEGAPLHLKAPYIQTDDPSQPKLHSGATISQISWSRRHIDRPSLTEAEGLAAAGPAYADRHQLVDAAMMAYLTYGVAEAVPAAEAVNSNGEEIDLELLAQLRGIAEANGLDLSRNDEEADDAPAAPASSAPSRPAAILAVLDAADSEGLDAAAIAAALVANGDASAEPNGVSATLSRMHREGEINRPARGRYARLDQTNEQTNA
jgi:hypothetical protein